MNDTSSCIVLEPLDVEPATVRPDPVGHRGEDEGGGGHAVHNVRPKLASLRQGPTHNGGGGGAEDKHPEPIDVVRFFNTPETNVSETII